MQLAWILPSLVLGAYLGASTGSWYMLAMSGMSALVAWFVRRQQAYKLDPNDKITRVGNRHYLGARKLPRAQLFWRKPWSEAAALYLASKQSTIRGQARLGEVRSSGFVLDQDKGVWLGIASQDDLIVNLASQAPHLLIVGPTGSGKSELCRLIAVGLANSKSLGFELALIDFKGGATFQFISSHPCVVGLATDLEDHTLFSAGLAAELARRERLLADAACSNIEEYQVQHSLPRLAVIVDEATAYIRSSTPAAELIEALATRGRSLGVHLVLATQTLSGLPRQVLANLRLRIAVGEVDPVDLMQMEMHSRNRFDEPDPPANWQRARLLDTKSRIQVFDFPLGATKNCGSISIDAL